MKKFILSLVICILSFVLTGCDLFGTPYDKMMNKFEKQIVGSEVIEIEQNIKLNFVGDIYGMEDTESKIKMTYFTKDQSIYARTNQMNQLIEIYLIQKENELFAYYIDDAMLYPIDMKEIEDTFPVDTTLFNLEDYTGKASWESDFTEKTEGVFSVEISLKTLFDDEMFEDIEESFTQSGATIEALDNKMATITVSYDETRGRLTMTFDMEAFNITMYSNVYTLKVDQEIIISSGTEKPLDMSNYHSYPVKEVKQIIRTYLPNEYFKGEFQPSDRGYFRFNLTAGKYSMISIDSQGMFDIYYYDKDLVKINPNLDGTFTAEADGIYYLEVVSKNDYGQFELKLVKTK